MSLGFNKGTKDANGAESPPTRRRRSRPWFIAAGFVTVVAGLTVAGGLATDGTGADLDVAAQTVADGGQGDGGHGKDGGKDGGKDDPKVDNGYGHKGDRPNGAPHGGAPNGVAPTSGAPTRGAPHGVAPTSGAPTRGAPHGGAPIGVAPNGGAPNGGAPNGGAPNGSAPNGSAPNGGAPIGVAPNGGAPNGQQVAGQAVPCGPDELISAIILANRNGGATLDLASRCTYILSRTTVLGDGLPTITSKIAIRGHDSTIVRDGSAPSFRIFNVGSGGILELSDLSLAGGRDTSGTGGGALLVDVGGQATVVNSTLSGNTSSAGGGAIFNRGATTVTHSAFVNNASTGTIGLGGAIRTASGQLTVDDSQLDHNAATLSGGGLHAGGSAVEIRNSTLTNNSAATSGGAFLAGTSTITGTTIANNDAATVGGGLLVNGGDSVSIRNSSISGNTAGGNGGGLFASEDSVAIVEDSEITGNSTRGNGGGVFASGFVVVRTSQVTGNTALGPTGQGAGIFSTENDGRVTLIDSRVTGNSSTLSPGGIFGATARVSLLGNAVVINNSPRNCQGVVSTVTLNGCFG